MKLVKHYSVLKAGGFVGGGQTPVTMEEPLMNPGQVKRPAQSASGPIEPLLPNPDWSFRQEHVPDQSVQFHLTGRDYLDDVTEPPLIPPDTLKVWGSIVGVIANYSHNILSKIARCL